MNNVKVNLTHACFGFKNIFISSVIKTCIQAALEAEKIQTPCEINVLITDNSGIRAINKAGRGIDQATDVLSFPMFQLEAGNPPIDWKPYTDIETGRCPLGDMAISLERAVSQAKEYGHSVRREVGYLTIHSILHLLGYDHLDEGPQKAQMRSREEEIASSITRMKRD